MPAVAFALPSFTFSCEVAQVPPELAPGPFALLHFTVNCVLLLFLVYVPQPLAICLPFYPGIAWLYLSKNVVK